MTTRFAWRLWTVAICVSSPAIRCRSSGSVEPAAARLLLMIHANGSIPARRRSAWSSAASVTGVVSASATMSTLVYAGFARRISGVSIRPECSALYAATVCL